jgi:hypothetical protein
MVFASAIVLTLWLDTAVSPYAAVRSLLVAIVVAGLLTAGIALAFRSAAAGGVGGSAVVGILWSRQLFDAAQELGQRMGPAAWILLAAAVLATLLAARIALRAGAGLTVERLNSLLNRASLLLLLATLAVGVVNGRLFGAVADLEQGVSLEEWPSSAADEAPPDVYAILLDGYPRADVLDYAFDIDNSDFVEALEDRGFEVADASHSDYLWTHVSVPSALNMAYVEQIPAMRDVIDGHAPRQPTLRRTVGDNVVFDTAREYGYTAVAIGAGFEEVAPRQADVYLDGGQLNEFELGLLTSTWTGSILNVVAPDFASSQLRQRVLHNLDALSDIAATRGRGPALVFAHVPAPHQPAVFASDGSPVEVPITGSFFADSPRERGEAKDEFLARYRDQLPYLNGRILAAIDGILAESAQPPVIVLFADHGSASEVDWNTTDPMDADPARLLERTGILFAAHTPGRGRLYPDDVSPVDLFRLVFDAYIGTSLGPAEPPADGGHIDPIDGSVLDAP